MIRRITRFSHPRIRHLRRLRRASCREAGNQMVIEGDREWRLAREAGVVIQEVFVSSRQGVVSICRQEKVPCFEVAPEVFERISYGGKTTGVVALAKVPEATVDTLPAKGSLFVVLEALEKPGNLGAVARTCDAVGVDGVLVCDGRTDIYQPNVIRASRGTVFSVRVARASNQEAWDFLRDRGIRVYATSPTGDRLYTEAKLTEPTAFVFGSEQQGLSAFWQTRAEGLLRLPMRGKGDSLNVSVSTAVLLYETLRQRTRR